MRIGLAPREGRALPRLPGPFSFGASAAPLPLPSLPCPAPPAPEPEARPEAVESAAFILSLRARGIRDAAVLGAMERVPREMFAPGRFSDLARADVALPLPCGQTMTAPAAVAVMLMALGLRPGQRVLEVGTGSGYVTAVLARLGGIVHSVERYASLARSAAARLPIAGTVDGITLAIGDGLAPAGEGRRYDRILVNGALPRLPASLASQLAPGGRLVGALTVDGFPRLVRLDRDEDGVLRQELGSGLRLAPLAPGRAQAL